MRLKIIWSVTAAERLDDIFSYYDSEAGEIIAKRIVSKILSDISYLSKQPFIGQVEPLLDNRNIKYRYLLTGNYKTIYSVDEENNRVKIADIFDTRQNPKKMKSIK